MNLGIAVSRIAIGSVNKVILIGNLGDDPEIRRMHDGRPIANLSVATSETWPTGERREKTEWHRVVIFNDCRGSRVYLEGSLQTTTSRKRPAPPARSALKARAGPPAGRLHRLSADLAALQRSRFLTSLSQQVFNQPR